EAMRSLKAMHNISETVLLSTCNRTEIYCSKGSPEQILGWWQHFSQINAEQLIPFAYSHQNDNAAKHAMRVASGLDSMILGEPQILGQLKSAYRLAQEYGGVGKDLSMLFQTSFQVAKHIRTHTQLGAHPVSIAYAAVKLAKNIFTHFEKVTVLLIGAGENIELLA